MRVVGILPEHEHSVSCFLSGLREGDSFATSHIWKRYFRRLISLANQKLHSSSRRFADEEDVVQAVFSDFFVQVQQGRFPKLSDRDDLWQVLAMLVDRRAKDQVRKQRTQRANVDRVIESQSSPQQEDSARGDLLSQLPSRVPTPAEAMEFVDALRSRLNVLSESVHREVAILKLQGYSNKEIASRICSSLRTVERILSRIRDVWQQ